MTLTEMTALFMDSRKRGTTGARTQCSEKTLKIYDQNLHVFVGYLESEGVVAYENIKRAHMLHFRDWLDTKGWAKASIYQVLRTLRTLFRWVEKDEDCQLQDLENIQRWLPAIPMNPRRLDIPDNKVLKKFKNTFNTSDRWEYRDYIAICLMMTNGMRLGELCGLKVANIGWTDHVLFVDGKQGERFVPTTAAMLRLLKGWLKKREGCAQAKNSPYVFVSKRSPQISVEAFGNALRKHRKKYDLPRVTAHTFRHAFCTQYLRGGGNIAKLMGVTGHKRVDQLLAYTHLAELGKKEAREELEKVNLLKEC